MTGLYIFLEGNDDERFFKHVIEPLLKRKFKFIGYIKYAELPDEKVNRFLESIQKIEHFSYIFVADLDQAPCVTRKKQEIIQKYPKVSHDRIIIVIKEIEGWYLAGLNEESSKKLKVRYFKDTTHITKEIFNSKIPKRYADSRIAFMNEILNRFTIGEAMKKNRSFRYFFLKMFGLKSII